MRKMVRMALPKDVEHVGQCWQAARIWAWVAREIAGKSLMQTASSWATLWLVVAWSCTGDTRVWNKAWQGRLEPLHIKHAMCPISAFFPHGQISCLSSYPNLCLIFSFPIYHPVSKAWKHVQNTWMRLKLKRLKSWLKRSCKQKTLKSLGALRHFIISQQRLNKSAVISSENLLNLVLWKCHVDTSVLSRAWASIRWWQWALGKA